MPDVKPIPDSYPRVSPPARGRFRYSGPNSLRRVTVSVTE
jgi:hypothetical protein